MSTKESGVAGRELGVAEGRWRCGWASCAALSVLMVPAMPHATIGDVHEVGSATWIVSESMTMLSFDLVVSSVEQEINLW
jgi:hypothetical protein